MLEHISILLQSSNKWLSSNAALVLARYVLAKKNNDASCGRLSISDTGLHMIITKPQISDIIVHLINCLGVDEAGCGMNCAFILGRICDSDYGIKKVLDAPNKELMVLTGLRIMLADVPLAGSNWGACKNACFCLSCLAGTHEGHDWIFRFPKFFTGDDYFFTCEGDDGRQFPDVSAEQQDNDVQPCCALASLARLLNVTNAETSWFAAMVVRSLISQTKGLVILRRYQPLMVALQDCLVSPRATPELLNEVRTVLLLMSPLSAPPKPRIVAYGSTSALVRWTNVEAPNGYQVTYQLYFQAEGTSEWKLVYSGNNLETRVRDLQPYTRYLITLRCSNDVEQGPLSEPTLFRTEEATPSAPTDLHAATVTTNQVRLIWSPPIQLNGSLHHYTVRVECAEKRPNSPRMRSNGLQSKLSSNIRYSEKAMEPNAIISGLLPNTTYTVMVSAVNGKGTGPAATLSLQTLETGPHWPEKPIVTVLGRSEVTVNWEPPKYTRGRIMRYEVYMNQGKSPVYSGTEQHCRLIGLRPDTEYTFVVAMITNEGKFESKPAKRKTAKDGYTPSPRVPSRNIHGRRSFQSDNSISPVQFPKVEVKVTPPSKDKTRVNESPGKSTDNSRLASLSMPCLASMTKAKSACFHGNRKLMETPTVALSMPILRHDSRTHSEELKKSAPCKQSSVPYASLRMLHYSTDMRNHSQPTFCHNPPNLNGRLSTNYEEGDRFNENFQYNSEIQRDMKSPDPDKSGKITCTFGNLCSNGFLCSNKNTFSRLPLRGGKTQRALSTGSGSRLDQSLYSAGRRSASSYLKMPFGTKRTRPPMKNCEILTAVNSSDDLMELNINQSNSCQPDDSFSVVAQAGLSSSVHLTQEGEATYIESNEQFASGRKKSLA
ncbi:fibronectin type III domain protein, partial [Opisthorchis viverrini]